MSLSEKMIKNKTQIPTIYVKEFINRILMKFSEKYETDIFDFIHDTIKEEAGEELASPEGDKGIKGFIKRMENDGFEV